MDDFNKTPNMYPNLNEQQSRLNKINEIKDYFFVEIRKGNYLAKILVNILLL